MANKKKIIIANWKMKLGLQASLSLASNISSVDNSDKEVVVCPTFVNLQAVGQILKETNVALGAQNVFWETTGAFTGEVSPKQLQEFGCRYVIIGHSERRTILGETDEMIHKKIRAALEVGLIPIVCVGESYEDRQKGQQDYVLIYQLTKALEGIDIKSNEQLIIAYEPVWAIGVGRAIKPEEAAGAHLAIRQTLIDLYSSLFFENNFRIVYGGSIDSGNVSTFTALDHTDGVLVGTASLAGDEFKKIIENA